MARKDTWPLEELERRTYIVPAKNTIPASILLHLRAVISLFASANPSLGTAHDPSWGIWPCTVLNSWMTCEQLPVLSSSPRKENDAALALGGRPIQQHEPAARQRCIAVRKATVCSERRIDKTAHHLVNCSQ